MSTQIPVRECVRARRKAYCKIDLRTKQKRPVCKTKETYVQGKRDLCTKKKRPMYTGVQICAALVKKGPIPKAKETHVEGKRDLCPCERADMRGARPGGLFGPPGASSLPVNNNFFVNNFAWGCGTRSL